MDIQELKELPIKEEVLCSLNPIASDMGKAYKALDKIYRQMGRPLTMLELAKELEERFGPQIVESVCLPYGVDESACLWIAARVAVENAGDN